MAIKLGKKEYPAGHSANDFKCFGPAATKDGEFETVKVADLGCFSQEHGDSNKYYHGAVVQSSKDSKWFAYFEWGRTGRAHPDFQFVACSSEAEAQREFASQLHSKNDKRGMWTTVAGIKTLTAKPGKDCYLVRPQATRATGLPDARTIRCDDGAKVAAQPTTDPKKGKAPLVSIDAQTLKLLNDLNMGTISYTKGAMADSSIPTQTSIDEARTLLGEATNIVGKLGDDVDLQVSNKDLVDITSLLYSRIPKVKPVGAPPSTWILSQNNIVSWGFDLDAFEQALYATSTNAVAQVNPLEGMGIEMFWVDASSDDGKWVYTWLPKATRNRHQGLGNMKIKGVWKLTRPTEKSQYSKSVDLIGKELNGRKVEKGFHQEGLKLSKSEQNANTHILIHGTRSVNATGILRSSLRLPKQLAGTGVAINGANYGPGLYFADDWKKSAGYCSLSNSYWAQGSGRVSGRNAFMFVTSVILGNAFVEGKTRGYNEPPKGHHSVFAKATNGTYIRNNEFIVYNNRQHHLDYLVEFDV